MISKNKTRVTITITKEAAACIQAAARCWGMSVSEYLEHCAMYDIERGTTSQYMSFKFHAVFEPGEISGEEV